MKFYSDILDKLFDTEKELKAAEKADAEAKAKKEEAKKLVKADAAKVEEAFKAKNAANRKYNSEVVELRKAYNIAVSNARKVFEESIEAAAKSRDEAEKAYTTALKEFQNAHPEGYHLTLKDGNNVTSVTTARNIDINHRSEDAFDQILSILTKIW